MTACERVTYIGQWSYNLYCAFFIPCVDFGLANARRIGIERPHQPKTRFWMRFFDDARRIHKFSHTFFCQQTAVEQKGYGLWRLRLILKTRKMYDDPVYHHRATIITTQIFANGNFEEFSIMEDHA